MGQARAARFRKYLTEIPGCTCHRIVVDTRARQNTACPEGHLIFWLELVMFFDVANLARMYPSQCVQAGCCTLQRAYLLESVEFSIEDIF